MSVAKAEWLADKRQTEFLADYLELDLDAVTTILKKKGVGSGTAYEWMGKGLKQLKAEGKGGGHDHFHVNMLDGYHGDFRKRDL